MSHSPARDVVKAGCRRRRRWYVGMSVTGALAVFGVLGQRPSGPQGQLPPSVLGALALAVLLTVLADLVWRCPVCKARLPRGLGPPPQYCPQCAVALSDPPSKRLVGVKGTVYTVCVSVAVMAGALLLGFKLPYHRPPHLSTAQTNRALETLVPLTPGDTRQLASRIAEASRLLARRIPGASLEGTTADLPLLQRVVDQDKLKPRQADELQSLGIAFGNVLAREAGFHWVIAEGPYGRVAALQYRDTSLVAYPLTMISQRVEDGRVVDLKALYRAIREQLNDLEEDPSPAPAAA